MGKTTDAMALAEKRITTPNDPLQTASAMSRVARFWGKIGPNFWALFEEKPIFSEGRKRNEIQHSCTMMLCYFAFSPGKQAYSPSMHEEADPIHAASAFTLTLNA